MLMYAVRVSISGFGVETVISDDFVEEFAGPAVACVERLIVEHVFGQRSCAGNDFVRSFQTFGIVAASAGELMLFVEHAFQIIFKPNVVGSA